MGLGGTNEVISLFFTLYFAHVFSSVAIQLNSCDSFKLMNHIAFGDDAIFNAIAPGDGLMVTAFNRIADFPHSHRYFSSISRYSPVYSIFIRLKAFSAQIN